MEPLVQTTRRSLIVGATAASLLAPAAPALAIVPDRYHSLMQRIMGLTWIGQGRTPSDRFKSGQFVMAIGMSFSLNSDWSYDGKMIEKVNLEGSVYESHSLISGECWVIGDEAGVSIYKMRYVRQDPLPAPFGWGTSKGDFRLYNDSQRKGRFTMQGVLTDDIDGTRIQVNLIDAD